MTKNYLKIALRNLLRHKGYTALNVAGLALGLACCLLILLYVQDERSYDTFNEKAERIYRLTPSSSKDGQPTNANGSFSAGPALDQDFAGVEAVTRFVKLGWGEKRVVANGERRFAEAGFLFADATVFDVFTFPFVRGTPARALVAPFSVVITQETARRYFGDADPLGQTLSVDAYNDGNFQDYTVTGVLRDLPAHSHLHFDFLASFTSMTGRTEGWGYDPVFTYVLLAPNADPASVEARLPAFLKRHVGPEPSYSLHLQPLLDIRLHSNLRAELEPNGSIAYVYLFSAVALFVLLIACINFMNLSTARSLQRAREVGVRKVLGARRSQLAWQFLGEAVLTTVLATAVALVFDYALLPVFNGVAGKEIPASALFRPLQIGGLALLAVIVGLAAGSYPAAFLSRFAPVRVLKGRFASGRGDGARLRRGLVVFQFGITIALMACTAVVYKQMQYMRGLNLGFAKAQIVILPLNDEIRARYDAAETAFLRSARVLGVTASEQVPARSGNGGTYVVEGREEPVGETRLFVNHSFNRTYGIGVAAGRDFSKANATDADDAYMVNEAFVREMGWTDPAQAVGKSIEMLSAGRRLPGHIVGVTKDFQLYSLRDGAEPAVLKIMPLDDLNFLSVRVRPERVDETLAFLRQTWDRLAPEYPFDYYFLDQDFERLHAADQRLGHVLGLFAGLAIFVSCLGLFGLAAFTAERRTREIGVRKVMGATVPGLVGLLARDFARLVLVAFVVATPMAYFAMHRWLEGFAYRTALSAWIFVLAGASALVVATATISYQSIRAALADPVKSLRHE